MGPKERGHIEPLLGRTRHVSKRWITAAAFAMALLGSKATAQTIQTLDGRPITADEIRAQVGQLMAAGHVEVITTTAQVTTPCACRADGPVFYCCPTPIEASPSSSRSWRR